MRQRGLAEARQVLDQQVPIREQGDEGEAHLLRLAQHQGVHLRLRIAQGRAQRIG